MSIEPVPATSQLVPGYRLDRYELLCPIAQGGMASVWVARMRGKHGFEKLVAIKTILPQYAQDLRFQKMFLDEAHIASGIEHTNVAQILDLGEEHDVLYLVMEWVDGDALSKLQRAVEKKNLAIPPGIVLRILADTCGGLHAAHDLHDRDGKALEIVHRDVSPQNILVTTKGVAKLIDFGIAKARDRVAGETNAGVLKGKIQYMAPEQAVGKAIDRRADVWAIGAILYHLISGRPPFDGPNQLATLHRLTSGKPPIPLGPRVPRAIIEVVRRALAFEPEQRFATAAEMQRALEDAMVQSQLVTTTHDVAAFCREHVAERAATRKRAVEVALEAAAERMRMQQVLQLPHHDSNSGVIDANHMKNEMPRMADIAADPATMTVPGVPVSQITGNGLLSSSGTQPRLMNSSSMSAVASTSAGIPSEPPPRARKGIWVAAILSVLVIAGVVVLVVTRGADANKTPDKGSATEKPAKTTPTPTTTQTAAASATETAAPSTTSAGPEPSAVEPKPSASATVPAYPTFKGKWPVPTASVTTAPTGEIKKKPKDDGF